jgi:hypothetical protein
MRVDEQLVRIEAPRLERRAFRNAEQSVRAFHSKLWWDPFKRPAPFVPAPAGRMERAWEDIMVEATQYRAIAAEHHHLAGMCRSPESREQHLRLEKEFLALADGKERSQGVGALEHASDPQVVR